MQVQLNKYHRALRRADRLTNQQSWLSSVVEPFQEVVNQSIYLAGPSYRQHRMHAYSVGGGCIP